MFRGSDVTIVMAAIEGRDELRQRALASVLTQTVKPATTVVFIDRNRMGAWAARNAALQQVETELVGFLDDDDWLEDGHIKALVRALNRSRADMVFSYPYIHGGRDPLACCYQGQLVPRPVSVPFGSDQRLHLDSRNREYCPACRALTGNFIPVTYIVRTDLVRAAGGFPAPYSIPECRTSGECEDYLCLLRMLDEGGTFHHLTDARTWNYDIHGANTGGRGTDRLHELQQLYRRIE